MDGLIVILIIIVAVVSTVSKGKKLDKNRPGQQRSAGQRPAGTQRPAAQARPAAAAQTRTAPPAEVLPRTDAAPAAPVGPAQPPVMQQLHDLLAELVEENEAKAQPAKAAPRPAFDEGESYMDDKDCVGGSLPHDESGLHEGESGMYTEPRQAREAGDAPITARRTSRVDAAALRQAVVMSEILGRPKALQRRAAGR